MKYYLTKLTHDVDPETSPIAVLDLARARTCEDRDVDTLRIGTRGSALARAQADHVATLLTRALDPPPLIEIEILRVSGGEEGTGTLQGPTDKRRWVDTIEQALSDRRIDLAVHSAKDVPGTLAQGLTLIGAPARADPEDVLCGAVDVDSLAPGARVGTSSARRTAQLRAAREDLEVIAINGNVDTRLRRLDEGRFDAIVLAHAGLRRLGHEERVDHVLDTDHFVPAPGQGTLALEGREADEPTSEAARAITDAHTIACLQAERTVARELGASCNTPLGAHAVVRENALLLRAWVGLPDGSEWAADQLVGELSDPRSLGQRVAQRLTIAGAAELLRRAEEMSATHRP